MIDRTNRRVLAVLESREKTVIRAWLKAAVSSGLLAHLEEVTTDMWDGYVEAVKEVFDVRVRITIDRFHVMVNFQEGLTDARREIQRALPKEAVAELKGTRWKWLTNEENLTLEDRQALEGLKRKYPMLAQLAAQRESLRAIFEDRGITTPDAGVQRLRAWCEGAKNFGLVALSSFTRTLERWMDKIANYFVSRSTNAQTEGYNHGLRAILWRAFGMRNFTHFRAQVLQAFG